MAADIAGRPIWLPPPTVAAPPEPEPLQVQYVTVPEMQHAGHPQYTGWLCCACNRVWSPVLVGCPHCNLGSDNG